MFSLVTSISYCCIIPCTLCRSIVELVLLVAWVVEESLLFGFVVGLEHPLSVPIYFILRCSKKNKKKQV